MSNDDTPFWILCPASNSGLPWASYYIEDISSSPIRAIDAHRAAEAWARRREPVGDYLIIRDLPAHVAVWLDSPEATAEIERTSEIPPTASYWTVTEEAGPEYAAREDER